MIFIMPGKNPVFPSAVYKSSFLTIFLPSFAIICSLNKVRWDLNCAFPWWLKMGNTSPHFYWNFCRNSFSRYKEAKRKTACNVLLLFFFNENFKDTDKLTWGLNRTIVNYAQRCLTIVNYNKGNDGNILCLYRGYDWIRTFRKINADTLKSLTCKLHFFFSEIKIFIKDFYFTGLLKVSWC